MEIRSTAGGVVINNDGDVLVVNANGNSWSLPKGGIEKDEDALDAAKREINEETGVKHLTFIKSLGQYERFKTALDGGDDMSHRKIIDMFLFHTNELVLDLQDPRHPEARWVKKEEVADLLTHRKDKEFFRSIVSELE